MASRSVFYSWQMDSDTKFNRNFIEDCLKRAIKNLNREDLPDLVIDRDTKNVPGMPDIGSTISEKIANSAVFVADLTLINPATVRRRDERPVSNPNVLFELGYAFGKLGTKVTIGVFNTASGEIEELPFELRPKRLMPYQLTENDNKAEVRAKLVDDLAGAIKQCIGDTEDDQIGWNSKVHGVLSELWLVGTEIEEWYGTTNLPEVIQNLLSEVQKLPDLMRRLSYSEDALSRVYYMITSLKSATTITLNEENWPKIRGHISTAANTIGLITHLHPFNIDPTYHDESVRRAAEMPTELDSHLEALANSQLHRGEIQKLAHELRKLAFLSLVPQHPQFAVGLEEISLDLRRYVLRWAKNNPKKDEAISAVRDVRERLAQLIDKYVPKTGT